MGHFKVNQKDIFFILKEQLQYGALVTLDRYKGLSEKIFDMLVSEAINFARGVVEPLQEIGEKHSLKYENGKVSCPPEFREVFRQYGRDGWIAAARDPEYGGQGFPHMMRIVINDMMYGACQAFNMDKLGLHSSPTCILNFGSSDDCTGFLCGEVNMGLAHMFQMMNAARINTGVSGMTLASTAYQNALEYVKARVQGRDIAGRKSGDVPIVDHPDVRRMLLWMKAMVEGMRSMIYTGAFWQDHALELPQGEQKQHYADLLDFMTPIIKAYCSDMGFRVCETAIQCMGGYGYYKEYPLEQYLRDAKIMSLYEGTNGIQSMDLMGRKMRINGGAPFLAYKKEIEKFCRQHLEHAQLGRQVTALAKTFDRLTEVAQKMKDQMNSDPLQWASHTYPALIAFGEVTMAWRLLDMAVIAAHAIEKGRKSNFYIGKIMQATYFTDVTLPHTLATADTALRLGREVVEMPEGAF